METYLDSGARYGRGDCQGVQGGWGGWCLGSTVRGYARGIWEERGRLWRGISRVRRVREGYSGNVMKGVFD